MPTRAILLVVLAAFIHASWNLLSKRAASVGPAFVLGSNIVSCIVYAPWVVVVLIRDKGFNGAPGSVSFVVLSGLIHLAYSLCLQRGYQVADLSVVYPVARGIGPTLSTLGAFALLGELPSAHGLAGLGLVVMGIGLITTQGDWSTFSRPGGKAGLAWGSATGGLIAAYTVVDGYAVKRLGIAPVVLDWFSNLLRLVLLAPLALRNLGAFNKAMSGSWWTAIAVGVLSPLSYILVLAAMQAGAPLSLVAPMREMSMMVVTLMGMLILRERVRPWRLIGCAVLIGGVILLSAA